jgi:hypothetical protein
MNEVTGYDDYGTAGLDDYGVSGYDEIIGALDELEALDAAAGDDVSVGDGELEGIAGYHRHRHHVHGATGYDEIIGEEEADWLGPAILVSEEAALRVAREGIPLVTAAELYRVSEQVMRFRLNVTAANKRVA